MTKLIAIELENFQSIENRIRIEFKPITMLFGPNSAGKSSVFDALELLQTLLDPIRFDENRVSEMTQRWVRRSVPGVPVRYASLALEFEIDLSYGPYEMWMDNFVNRGSYSTSEHGFCFWWDADNLKEYELKDRNIARIEISLRVEDNKSSTVSSIHEIAISLNQNNILSLSRQRSVDQKDNGATQYPEENDVGQRFLSISDAGVNIFFNGEINKHIVGKSSSNPHKLSPTDQRASVHVDCGLFSPFELTPSLFESDSKIAKMICQNAKDIFFYLGTCLFKPMREKPGVVRSDRRTPSPIEALAVVDFDLGGWWSRDSLSPSSPATLLKEQSHGVDEHFQGMAKLAHAEILLNAVRSESWGDSHAAKYIEDEEEGIRSLAKHLERINLHLEQSLFKEKLYKLSCVSTLMVPIDVNEEDPFSFYAFAQPAAVRLLLQDQSGQKIELQDVGSGIPFVLPVLYAATSQCFVMIQQPELHLHPALQSKIADVFIEESNASGSTRFLIETHSEHLLLRLLRRIRDTEKNRIVSDSLKLTNEDIATYYFDPKIGGATVVTYMPITPLGDFYTDWPRGFFEERNDDLFDKE
jgi:predicted ATPase